MSLLKRMWAHNKLTAIVMVGNTLGWALLMGLCWWALILFDAGLGPILSMLGITALFFLLFCIIWAELKKVYG